MRRVNPPFHELLIEILLDETLLTEANLLNREELDAFVKSMADLVNDPARKKWFIKTLPGKLLNSAADARLATPDDMPENPPAWMQKLPPGTAFDVFKAAPETIETAKAVAEYLNAHPAPFNSQVTWDAVAKQVADGKAALAAAAAAAAGDAWRWKDHQITRVRSGEETVYTLAPIGNKTGINKLADRDNPVRENWVTVTITVDAETKNVIKSEGYSLGVPNSTELSAIATRIIDEDGLKLGAGVKFLATLSGGHEMLLLVSDASRDWVGLLLKNCIGDGQYDLDKGTAVYALTHGTTRHVLAAMEFKDGAWAQTRQAENKDMRPELKALFNEFSAQPGLRAQVVRLAGGQMKLSTELADGDKVQGSLSLEGVQMERLPSSFSVNGDLVLKGSTLTELPPGLAVGGKLDLRDTKIKTLPEDVSFGSLRATFGKIDHEVVCRYVAELLHRKLLENPAFKTWLETDSELGPMKPEDRLKSPWVTSKFDQVLAKTLKTDWRKPEDTTEMAKTLRHIYA